MSESIRYAYVLFGNGVEKSVALSRIPKFIPKHRKDFNNSRKVEVWWLGNGEPNDCLYYANILLLGSKYFW